MKDHFIKLFDYDKAENEVILALMMETGTPVLAEKLMAHLLSANEIWFKRCKGIPPEVPILLWPDWKMDTFEKKIKDNHQQWVDFLNETGNEEFDNDISYKNSSGNSFENKLIDIMTHLINHGTHHRAQIGQHLKQAGLEKLPNTDYIGFLRADLLR